MNPLVAGLASQDGSLELKGQQVLFAMGNSVATGILLMLITVWASYKVAKSKMVPSEKEKAATSQDIVLNSMNVLFLCFGMTGVMLLVNNNLARAFAIGAAIALVRFRIKVDNKVMSMAFFYGVLAGMACGVGQPMVAWIVAIVFGLLQGIALSIASVVGKKSEALPRLAAAPRDAVNGLAAQPAALSPVKSEQNV